MAGPNCSNDVDCRQGSAPFCFNGTCACGNIAACPFGQVCTIYGAGKACLVDGGYPCVSNQDCASGGCTGGLCSPLATGQWCVRSTQTPPDCVTCCRDGKCAPSGDPSACQ